MRGKSKKNLISKTRPSAGQLPSFNGVRIEHLSRYLQPKTSTLKEKFPLFPDLVPALSKIIVPEKSEWDPVLKDIWDNGSKGSRRCLWMSMHSVKQENLWYAQSAYYYEEGSRKPYNDFINVRLLAAAALAMEAGLFQRECLAGNDSGIFAVFTPNNMTPEHYYILAALMNELKMQDIKSQIELYN